MRRKMRIAAKPALVRLLSLVLCAALSLSALPARSLSIGESPRLCGHVGGDGEGNGFAHICHIVSFDGYTPGTPLITYAAPDGTSNDAVISALPATLTGRLSCSDAPVDIPVSWRYDAFTGEIGVRTFRAVLTDAHCDYVVSDDPATPDFDESVTPPYCDLPTAEVTASAPVTVADPSEGPSTEAPIDIPLASPVDPARGHACRIVSFADFDPLDEPAVAQFVQGRTTQELYDEVLPKALAVTYACACASPSGGEQPGSAAELLPVTWECAYFDPAKTGDYLFTVKALADHPFTYLAVDDPATDAVDEGRLPGILVRVYQPTSPAESFTVCYGVLNSDKVNVRSGPGTIYESLAQFDTDTPVTVTGQCDHWYRVDIATYTGAFIDKSLINVLEGQTEAAAPMTGTLNADNVKIRQGPDRTYDVITVLSAGEKMTLLGRCGNWYNVSTDEIEQGYVWRDYVTIDPPAPVEEPECTCSEHCAEGHVNADCPVCAENIENCAVLYVAEGYPRTGRVNADECEVLVGTAALHLRLDTALTLYSEADGHYVFSSDEIEKGLIASEFVTLDPVVEYVCTCTAPCTETVCNQLCPVCAAGGFGACAIKTLSEQTITASADDGSTIEISGSLPAGAEASVAVVPVETAAEFVAEGAEILFAYDIKILVAGVEWQPNESVQVRITPPPETSIESDVSVTHVSEDADTGAVTTSTVTDVSTTLSDESAAQPGAVEFAAEGFSVYIGTVNLVTTTTTTTLTLAPGADYQFYSDAVCTQLIPSAAYTVQNTSEDAYIYAKAAPSCEIVSISYKDLVTNIETNYNGTIATDNVVKNTDTGVWALKFPTGMANNQLIKVFMSDSAPGGTITTGSTAADVAKMFDATAGSGVTETANVSVSGSGGTFTVTIKKDILLQGTITVANGANVTLTVPGGQNLSIKRDVVLCNGSMFQVDGTLSLGTGTEGASSVTYNFSNGNALTGSLNQSHVIPAVEGEHITGVQVSAGYTCTTAGTLTIDGGANFTTRVDAANKTYPVCSTVSTGSIVNSTGKLMLWNDVTLQNNYNHFSSDRNTYAGVRIQGGSFYMYGGKITQCSTLCGGSLGDGGGVCFLDGNAYFFGGEITECCADNGAAVAIFGSDTHPTAYYLGTSIHHNLAGGDGQFPGQACSGYDGAAVRMYAGSITDNKNSFSNDHADYDMKPSGTNSGVHLFGGSIGKLGVVEKATVNVYSCTIDQIYGAGKVNYITGYSVIIPDCVALNTTDTVIMTVEKSMGSAYMNYITVEEKGDGVNRHLVLTLPPGEYRFTVDSPSMRKEYEATVTGSVAGVDAEPKSRTMTAPVVMSRTTNSITLKSAGNGNPDANGAIFYGYSSTDDVNSVLETGDGAWQSEPAFNSGLTGTLYFFVKASAPSPDSHSFGESKSTVSLSVNFDDTPSVDITGGEDIAVNVGATKNIPITTNPADYDSAHICWSILGTVQPGTSVTKRPDGNGSLVIAADESAGAFDVKVELLDKDNASVANDTVRIHLNPFAQIISPSFEVPSVLTAGLISGNGVTATGYQWYREDSQIVGGTGSTYATAAIDVNKAITVRITGSDGNTYESLPVTIAAPQLSVTVPTTMAVKVNAAGECSVPDNMAITNDSAVPVYVTGVSYAWVTGSGGNDANELFYDYSLVTATLTLSGTGYSFSGTSPTAASPTSAAGRIAEKVDDTPGTLPLSWTFDLGENNHLKLAPAVGSPLHVATVTYTIDYQPATP